MAEKFLDVLKWSLIIIVAAIVYYGLDYFVSARKTQSEMSATPKQAQPISSQYSLIDLGRGAAYRLERNTGKVWMVTPTGIRSIEEEVEEKDERVKMAHKYYIKWKWQYSMKDSIENLAEIEEDYGYYLLDKEAKKVGVQKILEMMGRVDKEFEDTKRQRVEKYLQD